MGLPERWFDLSVVRRPAWLGDVAPTVLKIMTCRAVEMTGPRPYIRRAFGSMPIYGMIRI